MKGLKNNRGHRKQRYEFGVLRYLNPTLGVKRYPY